MDEERKQAISVGELESAVLEYLWHGSPATARTVHEFVGAPRRLAYTTILTVLQRLTRKGLARRSTDARAHLYSAAISREQAASRHGEDLGVALARVGNAGVAAFLAEARRLDPAVVEELRRQLEADS